MENENIVKQTCKELGVTQKELAELLGIHLTTVQKWVQANEFPISAKKSIDLLHENSTLKNKLLKFQTAFDLIDEARGK